jgi:menaquinol-cytochrome c reductase cytochrome b/c subunit
VQAALAQKGNGGGQRTATRYAGQEHTHRLLAMVPPTGIQQIRNKQEDKVYTWPHLIGAEGLSLLAVTAFLTVFSVFMAAPLQELANPNVTPDPSKAPWYFLGLQELLAYFHPIVAGVTIPTVGIIIAMMLPYVDKNPSVRPENRKFAMVGFTFALVFNAALVMVGSFFRGPGFNWVWPWVDGLWFVL